MVHTYEALCTQLGLPCDTATLSRLREESSTSLKSLESDIVEAREKHGAVEVGAAVMKKAQYLGTIGDKEGAVKAYKEMPEKALSTGGKADIAMACARLGFVHGDKKCVEPFARLFSFSQPLLPKPPL
jgi:26S proteasome regulatory subunit N7